jgi:hypothetical protein
MTQTARARKKIFAESTHPEAGSSEKKIKNPGVRVTSRRGLSLESGQIGPNQATAKFADAASLQKPVKTGQRLMEVGEWLVVGNELFPGADIYGLFRAAHVRIFLEADNSGHFRTVAVAIFPSADISGHEGTEILPDADKVIEFR